MKLKTGKKSIDQFSTKSWEAEEDNKLIFITSILKKSSILKMKSIFITEEKAQPTGSKF